MALNEYKHLMTGFFFRHDNLNAGIDQDKLMSECYENVPIFIVEPIRVGQRVCTACIQFELGARIIQVENIENFVEFVEPAIRSPNGIRIGNVFVYYFDFDFNFDFGFLDESINAATMCFFFVCGN